MSFGTHLSIVGLLLMAWLIRPGKRRSTSPEGPPHPLQIAYCLELLALAMAAGAPATSAIHAVATAVGGRAGDELNRVSAATQWGVDGYRAWVAAPGYWAPAARAFHVAATAGAAPSTLLRQAAADLRQSEKERVETAAAKAGVRVVLPLGLCFLPAFITLTIIPLVLGLVDLG